MHADDDGCRGARHAAEPFDLVGVDIGRRHLHRRRQVQDRPFALRRRLPYRIDRIANLDREIEFGAGEALRAVLEHPLGVRMAQRQLAHGRRAAHRDVDDAGADPVRNTTRRCSAEVEL
jgi:hypothetical protein